MTIITLLLCVVAGVQGGVGTGIGLGMLLVPTGVFIDFCFYQMR